MDSTKSDSNDCPVHEVSRPSTGHFEETVCLNCGAELLGAHCHACGQEAHLHRTVGALFHDLLHGALHFEGKTWHTLPALILKPGELTRRYIDGERKRFVSPMGIFLFSIFLMFAVFQAIGLSAPSEMALSTDVEGEMVTLREQTIAVRDGYQRDMDAAEPGSYDYRYAKLMRDDAADDLKQITQAGEVIIGGEGLEELSEVSAGDGGFLDHAFSKWEKNPGLMVYKLQSNGYKFSWMLIPISVPFVWLLFFWKRRFGAYDHAVFVTYSIAFMSLFFVTFSLLVTIGTPAAIWGTLLFIVPPLHIYKQLRGTYDLSRFGALWRLIVLSIFVLITTALFAQFLFVLGSV
ncbi:DUF3667 domain-containing protein [Erythrobacter litoralis]|uniref:DUF3667 domain-containing protein n=1 Tax=Erythrobacter litoralis TaxID=39960 RepID=UPI00243511BB|nr:DUF3667 domain-containing protein [Erythrobacter litoralis]